MLQKPARKIGSPAHAALQALANVTPLRAQTGSSMAGHAHAPLLLQPGRREYVVKMTASTVVQP
jgi:hypothetical protein